MRKAYRVVETLIVKSGFARMIRRFVNFMVDELIAEET